MKKPHKIGTSITKKVDYSELFGKLVVISAIFGVLYFITTFILNEVNPNYKKDFSRWLVKTFSVYKLTLIENATIVCDMGFYYEGMDERAFERCKKEFGVVTMNCPYLDLKDSPLDFKFEFNGINVNIKRYLFNKKQDEFNNKYVLLNGKYNLQDYGKPTFNKYAESYYKQNISEYSRTYGCEITKLTSEPPMTKFNADEVTFNKIKNQSLNNKYYPFAKQDD